jgi:hypothetical protein
MGGDRDSALGYGKGNIGKPGVHLQTRIAIDMREIVRDTSPTITEKFEVRACFRLISFVQQRVCKLKPQSSSRSSPPTHHSKEEEEDNLKRRPIPISTTNEESQNTCIIVTVTTHQRLHAM